MFLLVYRISSTFRRIFSDVSRSGTNKVYFRVKSNKPVDFVESKKYNQYVDDWLLWIKDYVKPQVVILLNIINSLKTLQVLKESIPVIIRII